ncbi:MAG: alkaline phosphatase family protein [Crocinitomicaceae bacterium]|nr:alkaline phosphatase family protein [Crocinitomicaceae bacterium]
MIGIKDISFLRRTKLALSLIGCTLIIGCKSDKVNPDFITEHVFIVVIDGPRYTETWGDPYHANIQLQSALQAEGTLYTNFRNTGMTFTVPGHVALTTGYYQEISNNGLEIPSQPSIFQYWMHDYNKTPNDAWIIASKDKLAVLANCEETSWTNHYMPMTNCGVNGLGVGNGYRDDSTTFVRAMEIINEHHPSLTLINFREPDYSAHSGDWGNYLEGIQSTDQYIDSLWKFIQSDPIYKDKTTLFVTNDHGRHSTGIENGFAGHGDGCEGCRRISLLALGPDFKKGVEINELHSQIDIPLTISYLLDFKLYHHMEGRVLTGLKYQ